MITARYLQTTRDAAVFGDHSYRMDFYQR